MFTEYEIDTMIGFPEVLEATLALKQDFVKAEAPYLEIDEHNFFSLIMMVPTIGIAMADGNISLFEEITLNKKARKLSRGTYFIKKDPVIYAMKFIIKKYDDWSDKFHEVLKITLERACNIQKLSTGNVGKGKINYESYKQEVLETPYIVIRFIASFFLENDEDIINKNHKIKESEYQRMLLIGEKLGLNKLKIFYMFCQTFRSK